METIKEKKPKDEEEKEDEEDIIVEEIEEEIIEEDVNDEGIVEEEIDKGTIEETDDGEDGDGNIIEVEEIVDEAREEGKELEDTEEEETAKKQKEVENERDNLRDLILQQFANLEQSDVSDDESYKVRLSCILEDDESESSGANQREIKKISDSYAKGYEKGITDLMSDLAGSVCDSEISDELPCENYQITDLDADSVTLKHPDESAEVINGIASDDLDDLEKRDYFPIQTLKSSDDVRKGRLVVRRRELSSDSSDLDISVTTSTEGPVSDKKLGDLTEASSEKTLTADSNISPLEPKEIASEEMSQERTDEHGVEVVDNETLSTIFAKVSKKYLEKTKGPVKWEENEVVTKAYGEAARSRGQSPGAHLSIQDALIRGTSSKEYNPPVPPETYLWEELKRLRERGGYPWTYLDKPAFDEATWKKYMEHVYEPINPLPLSSEGSSPTENLAGSQQVFKGSSIPETSKQLLRVPSSKDTQNSECDVAEDSNYVESMEVDSTPIAQVQSNGSEKHISSVVNNNALNTKEPVTLAPVKPTVAPSSILKKIPTNDLDSVDIEEIHTKSGTLGRTRREQIRAHAQEMQEKLRSHAGRIRTKFNNIKRPTFNRTTNDADGEKRKFRFPEMHARKINFPDRSKFKLPEKARFHLPESARLHLPDKSKFHLPEIHKFNLSEKIHLPDKSKFHLPDKSKFERAKIHLPDKSKFHLPERPKLHLVKRAKSFHLPEKAKFHLPNRSSFHLPEKAKFHLPNKQTFHLPEKAKFHLPDKAAFHLPDFNIREIGKLSRPKFDIPRFGASKDLDSPLPSAKKFGVKSYPKLFAKHSKDYVTSSPKQTRGCTPPPRRIEPPSQKSTDTLMKKVDEIQYADDDLEEDIKETDSRISGSLFEYRNKDVDYTEDSEKDLEHVASNTLPDYGKKGVLEEINSDEYFLREKGISQDDIAMGKYLSDEIREAFRSPGVNALASIDYMHDENIDPKHHQKPERPARTGCRKKKSILKKTSTSDPSIADSGYKTYPPRRPGRKSRSHSKSLLNEEAVLTEADHNVIPEVDRSRYDNVDDASMSRYDDCEVEEEEDEDVSEYYKSPKAVVEYEHYKVPRSYGPPSLSAFSVDRTPSPELLIEPPKPVARKKNKMKQKVALDGQQSSAERRFLHENIQDPKKIARPLEDNESPVPPKRTRSRSSATKLHGSSMTMDDDEIDRSFQSESDGNLPLQEEIIMEEKTEMKEESPLEASRLETETNQLQRSEYDDGYRKENELINGKMDGNEDKLEFAERDSLDIEFIDEEIIRASILGLSEPISGIHGRKDLNYLDAMDDDFLGIDPFRPRSNQVTDLDDVGFGYATVGKSSQTKPERQKKEKPARPQPPKRKKETSLPIYNTYPRRTPIRPLRNYCTLGPSKPPRRKKTPKTECFSTNKDFRTYAEIRNKGLPKPQDHLEISGSSKDLQTEKVIEKMKGRPLPPPPRPPRQKSRGSDDLEPTEADQISMSIFGDGEVPFERRITAFVQEPRGAQDFVEEVSASTQTDILSDDFLDEECRGERKGVIQEFSHEQLKIQQAFLDEMKREEEEMRRNAQAGDSDLVDLELKAEVIKQIQNIIDEEKKILKDREQESSRVGREVKGSNMRSDEKGRYRAGTEADLGYASLEKRDHRKEPGTVPVPHAQASQVDKLQVREIEADLINVHEVQADQIFVKEFQGNRVACQDLDNTGGNVTLGNVSLPSSFIDQVVAKIPWETIRQSQERTQAQEPSGPPVRPQRRQRPTQGYPDDSDDEGYIHRRRSCRRSQHRYHYHTDDEDDWEKSRAVSRSSSEPARSIPELSFQLARACTTAGIDAVRGFVEANVANFRSLDRELWVQIVVCIAVALVAAYFLFGLDAKIIHLHRWDFQFPRPPPNQGT